MKPALKKLLFIYAWIPLAVLNLTIAEEQHFVFLAKSFLAGSLYFQELPNNNIADLAIYNNHYFWPLGPFPVIPLLPFVLIFGNAFLQGIIQLPLNILNFILVYKIGNKLGLEKTMAHLLAFFFIFGSTYTVIAAIPFSWYFAHVIATSLILAAIYEFLTRKRYLLIGTYIALAVLTRSSLVFASVFFFLTLQGKKPANAAKIATPIVLALVILTSYNFARFRRPLESGYKYQVVPHESALRRAEGLFSITHVPTNLYYMLLKGFDPVSHSDSHTLQFPYIKPNHYGLSIFILSPVLFLIFKSKLKDKYVKAALITTAIISLPIITYYGVGYIQVGYRYALDFLPFLLIPLSYVFAQSRPKTLFILTTLGIVVTWIAIIIHISRV